MMTEKSIYCSICYSRVELIGNPSWVFCPVHGLEKAEVAVSLEDILNTLPEVKEHC